MRTIILYTLIVLALLYSINTQPNQCSPYYDQAINGRGSQDDTPEIIIDRLEWTNGVRGRTNFVWRILMISITCSAILMMVATNEFPDAMLWLQLTFILFTLLYSAHKYFDRHYEIFPTIYNQDNINRLRERLGVKKGEMPPKKSEDVFAGPEDRVWYVGNQS